MEGTPQEGGQPEDWEVRDRAVGHRVGWWTNRRRTERRSGWTLPARSQLGSRLCGSLLCNRELTEFLQFAAQAMPEGAFRPQLFQERFRLGKRFVAQIAIFEQIPPTTRDFTFGEQA